MAANLTFGAGAVEPPAAAACLARISRPRRSASFLLAPFDGSPSSGLPGGLVEVGLASSFFRRSSSVLSAFDCASFCVLSEAT